MKIDFVKEDGTIYAISTDAIYRQRVHDELLWAEIEPKNGKHRVMWEDNHLSIFDFDSLMLAQTHISQFHLQHKPYINGNSYKLES